MSITINGATNTLTAASGLTIAGNTAVTGTLGFGEGGSGGFLGIPIDTGYMRIHGSNAINQGAGIILFGTGSAAPDKGRLLAAASTVAEWSSTGLAVTGTLSASGVTSVTDTTDATSTTSASLKTAGGLAVAKKLYVGDNIVMAAGQGIDFSATANGSGTTTSEVLSDYEEGTFTPTIILGGGSVTYTSQVGSYTKVGRLVTVQIYVQVNVATTPSGTLEIGGMPFTISAGGKGAISIQASGVAAGATTCWTGEPTGGATVLRLFTYAAGALSNPGAYIANSCTLNITASYEV